MHIMTSAVRFDDYAVSHEETLLPAPPNLSSREHEPTPVCTV